MAHGDALLDLSRRAPGPSVTRAIRCRRCGRVLRTGELPALEVLCRVCSPEAEPDETGFPRPTA